jgi:hypothetical protein
MNKKIHGGAKSPIASFRPGFCSHHMPLQNKGVMRSHLGSVHARPVDYIHPTNGRVLRGYVPLGNVIIGMCFEN